WQMGPEPAVYPLWHSAVPRLGGGQSPQGPPRGLDRAGVRCGDGLYLPPGALLQPRPAALDPGGPDRLRRGREPLRLRGRGGHGGAGSDWDDRGSVVPRAGRRGGVPPERELPAPAVAGGWGAERPRGDMG